MNPETTLAPGAYTLPNNCRAFVRNGKVIVSLKCGANDTTPRCRDCKHCVRAKSKIQSILRIACVRFATENESRLQEPGNHRTTPILRRASE